jgi:hypothetical protein
LDKFVTEYNLKDAFKEKHKEFVIGAQSTQLFASENTNYEKQYDLAVDNSLRRDDFAESTTRRIIMKSYNRAQWDNNTLSSKQEDLHVNEISRIPMLPD